MNEEYKVIRVSMPTYGYLMDNRTLYYKSMDSVIWRLVDDKSKADAKIKELEVKASEFENEAAGLKHEVKELEDMIVELKERTRLEPSQV
jgi:uncharacterized protein YfcZ (UPF0381/DUF406 family)